MATKDIVEVLRRYSRPLQGSADDRAALIAAIGNARLVLIGEATHGTHEFYRIRAELTAALIETNGFNVVAVEADWPDAYRVNRWVRHISEDSDAAAALSDFTRFPRCYEDERDHLAAQPELLDPAADTAIEEALLQVEENDAERYRQLRVDARADGVDAAYRPLLLLVLASRFAAATPAEQREMLTTRADLLDDRVREHLASAAADDEDDEGGEVSRAAALLSIAAADDGSILAATFDALEDPARFPALLDTTARATESTPSLLQPLAEIALTAATTTAAAATAGLYLAVAAAVAGEQEQAIQIIGRAVTWDPASRSSWIVRLTGLAATQPSVLPLIAALAGGGDDGAL